MTEPEMPVSQTARDIIAKLHPAIKEEWRVKLLKIEGEAVWHYRESGYPMDDPNPVPDPDE